MSEYTIELHEQYQYWAVYEWGVYEDSSVLAGQNRKSFIGSYTTLEEAQEKYPTAQVGYREANNTVDHLPDRELTPREEEDYWLARSDVASRNYVEGSDY